MEPAFVSVPLAVPAFSTAITASQLPPGRLTHLGTTIRPVGLEAQLTIDAWTTSGTAVPPLNSARTTSLIDALGFTNPAGENPKDVIPACKPVDPSSDLLVLQVTNGCCQAETLDTLFEFGR